jgi:hypothetical protein
VEKLPRSGVAAGHADEQQSSIQALVARRHDR